MGYQRDLLLRFTKFTISGVDPTSFPKRSSISPCTQLYIFQLRSQHCNMSMYVNVANVTTCHGRLPGACSTSRVVGEISRATSASTSALCWVPKPGGNPWSTTKSRKPTRDVGELMGDWQVAVAKWVHHQVYVTIFFQKMRIQKRRCVI